MSDLTLSDKSEFIRHLLVQDGEAEPNNIYCYDKEVQESIINHTHLIHTQDGTEAETKQLKFREIYYITWRNLETLDDTTELIRIARCKQCRIIVFQISGNRDMQECPSYDRFNRLQMKKGLR